MAKGRDDLVARHRTWWLYDRRLYGLRRIVRTEMATARHRAVIAASRDDPDVIGYHWRLSASHPEPDICDYCAGIELGLGRGVWPVDQVPESKAHPHCMCSLVPRVSRRRARGETRLEDFLAHLPEKQRAALTPRWARDLNALGVPWERLKRPDGLWFISKKEAAAMMGAERFAAAQSLGRALREPGWPVQDISTSGGKWRRTRAFLEPHADAPEVRRFIDGVDRAAGRGTDSRTLHYLERRYIDGEPLREAADLDRWAGDVLKDAAARVHRRGGAARYHLDI